MIVASEIELRAGARLLLESASFHVAAGDRIGLVGRNGAGKTTLAKVLAGQGQPAAGSVRRARPAVRARSGPCRRIRAPGTWRRWLSTGCCRPAVWISSGLTCALRRPRWL